jgi:hypothetical protein
MMHRVNSAEDLLIGCRLADGARVQLDVATTSSWGGARAITPISITGDQVAWVATESDRYGTKVVQVAARSLADAAGERSLSLPYDLLTTRLREVVAGPDLSPAWISDTGVYVSDGAAPVRVDRGPAGSLTDLRVDGSDVIWRHGGQDRRASLVVAPGVCALEPKDMLIEQTQDAVLVKRGDDTFGCLRAGTGFIDLGARDDDPRLAGSMAALDRPRAPGQGSDVAVFDLASGAQVGPTVQIPPAAYGHWDVAADGTVAIGLRGSDRPGEIVAHRPDGTVVSLIRGPVNFGRPLAVDDVTRRVTWGRGDGKLRAALPVAAIAARARGCVRAGERIVARSPDAVLVRDFKHKSHGTTACLLATHRRVGVTGSSWSRFGPSWSASEAALGGPYVAWLEETFMRSQHDAKIMVRDLRGGPVREVWIDETAVPTQLVVDPLGRVAYENPAGVYVLDEPFPRRVDRGVVDTLGIDGGDVTWSHAGQPGRASLTPPVDACVPERDDFARSGTSEVVLAQRNSGVGKDNRTDMRACLRATGSFVTVGVHRARTAGNVAAAEQPDGSIAAVDLVSLTRVGGAPPIDPVYDRWDVLPDGAIVVGHPAATGNIGTLTAYLPDGRAVTLDTGRVGDRDRLLVDDVTRVVRWGDADGPVRGVVPR